MKKPLFNEFDRQVIRENDSLFASNARLYMAKVRLEKSILRNIWKLIKRIQSYL